MVKSKTCSKCGTLYEGDLLDFFYAARSKKSGVQSRCKRCVKEHGYREAMKLNKDYNKDRYDKYKEKLQSVKREYLLTPRGRVVTLLNSAKTRAIKKGVEFDLDVESMLSLLEGQNNCCLLTGIEFDFSSSGGSRKFNPKAPSLDRIDPKKGYTPGNVRLVLTCVNLAFNEWGQEFFESWVSAYITQRASLDLGHAVG